MTVDIFYKEIKTLIESYEQSIVSKEFTSKSGPIELVPINIAKGQQLACKNLMFAIEDLYKKKYKVTPE